ncbi:hypothetical protein PAEPH01_1289 [Pancytospora epiphaga]|nr:hypothetical protein PAEPH01_1289 [Pancytospora epiphaga]
MNLECKERLHLPENEIGRRLHGVKHRNELMLPQSYNMLERTTLVSTCRVAILKQERAYSTYLATIISYLTTKYSLALSANASMIKGVEEARKKLLYSKIQKKPCHEKLYKMRSNELVIVKNSFSGLSMGTSALSST